MKKGLFWCIDYNCHKPSLIIKAVECDFNGNALNGYVEYSSKSGENFNHKIEWPQLDKNITKGKKYNYYPRGRVEIKNAKATIFLNPDINKAKVIEVIIKEFGLEEITNIKIIADGSKHYSYSSEKVQLL